MENYLDLINDYLKERNDLMCFNSYSNDHMLATPVDPKPLLPLSVVVREDTS